MTGSEIVDQLLEANPNWKVMKNRFISTPFPVIRRLAANGTADTVSLDAISRGFNMLELYGKNDMPLGNAVSMQDSGNPGVMDAYYDEATQFKNLLDGSISHKTYALLLVLKKYYTANIGDEAVIESIQDSTFTSWGWPAEQYQTGPGIPYSELSKRVKKIAVLVSAPSYGSEGSNLPAWWHPLSVKFMKNYPLEVLKIEWNNLNTVPRMEGVFKFKDALQLVETEFRRK